MTDAARERLLPHHVRAVVFDTRWRGLDPVQVRDHLDRVADELERLNRELITARTQNDRVRQALRQWQSQHRACRRRDPDLPDGT
ncbi:DivIVA domain-containing protein [Micromonospora sp. WMMD998]|uniref:DivIVA domain-containing protein n=1 Tax=Micromonospora sp. WMMD998 TaxID=3016092 RepID=UPI00249BE161|nr:DivIVA domain-containing protein [Micromonospora sp. WMMD998]WFE39387.1 DivIVA domain-containing protein [Micromonospora sp. WMMD998]